MTLLKFIGRVLVSVAGLLCGVFLGSLLFEEFEDSLQKSPSKSVVEDITYKYQLPEELEGCRIFHLQSTRMGDYHIVCNKLEVQ